jgi:hypothetical protein
LRNRSGQHGHQGESFSFDKEGKDGSSSLVTEGGGEDANYK